MFQGNYTIYGADASYFTRKVQAYLRYMRVPHDFVYKGLDRETVEQRSGSVKIPVVRTPEDWYLWDSTPMAAFFQARFPDRPIIPATPAQYIASLLLEDWIDEWFTRPAVSYRWHQEPDRTQMAADLGCNMGLGLAVDAELSPEQIAVRDQVGGMIRAGATDVAMRLGAGPEHNDEVRGRFMAFCRHFADHLQSHAYFLGERPSIADFALGGALLAHFTRDPTPRAALESEAPAVIDYAERLWRARAGAEAWLADDALPDSLAWFFKEMTARYHVYLRAQRDAVAEGRKSVTVGLGFGPTEILVVPYREAARRALRDDIERLDPVARERVDRVLGPSGALDVYLLPDIGEPVAISELSRGAWRRPG